MKYIDIFVVLGLVILILLSGCVTNIDFNIKTSYQKNYNSDSNLDYNINNMANNFKYEIIPKFDISAYNSLLNDSRILKAIELNPLVHDNNYKNILIIKIEELESKNTSNWNNYKHDGPWAGNEQLIAYLQKVAHILYVENHHLVPWSIFDYDEHNFNLLLSDLYIDSKYYIESETAVFNGNPTIAFEYIQSFYQKFPKIKITHQKELLDLIIKGMRSDNWKHFPNQTNDPTCDYFALKKDNLIWYDYNCLVNLKLGADGITSDFLYASLQAYNIPSIKLPQFLHGHTGINFSSIKLVMKGNDVYNSWSNGFFIKNNLPIDLTYLDEKTYNQWDKLTACEAASKNTRKDILNYLELYTNNKLNQDIKQLFCFQAGNYKKGEYLKEQILSIPTFCQNNNTDENNYYEYPLTEKEIQDWLSKISKETPCE